MSLKHAKVSAVADAGESSLVQPSDWNAAHTFDSVSATVDFGGASTGVEDGLVSTTVAATWAEASSVIACTVAPYEADHGAEDVALDGVSAVAANIVAGVGFDIIVSAREGTWGRYTITATGLS